MDISKLLLCFADYLIDLPAAFLCILPVLEHSRIGKKQLFVLEEEGAPHAVFAFILGEDPTYQVIENGAWPNHKPYGTIHRIGSDQTRRGVLSKALDFALQFTDEVRADTHEDNKPMQHTLAKNGFIRCGIIYLENGDPRIAYQYSKEA